VSIPWGDIATFSTAALSAVATAGAWLAAHRSAATADALARIERDRWHAELTPEFDVAIERGEGDRATLTVRLTGPIPLKHLDEIVLRVVSSDDMDHTRTLPGGPTREELDAQTWGPCRFSRGADGADDNGQTVAPFSLQVNQGRPFSIEKTRPPRWQTAHDAESRWRSEWFHKPMRLVITCKREGFDPWTVPRDVEVPHPTRTRWM
jgi:hypothetical protein